jgi:uncharacterized membrane protein
MYSRCIMTGQPLPPHIIPKDRVGNIIDAIYAFSMTLLVTTISVPPKYDHTQDVAPVQAILTNVLPDILHYFIAFIILALFWYFEHQRFRHLSHLDRPLLCLNIASLSFVCLLPFSTNVAGDYPFDTFGSIIFEVNILIIGLIAFIQWIYIRNRAAELVPGLDGTWVGREIRWSLVLPCLAVTGIALAVFHVPASSAIFLLAPFIMAYLYWNDPVKRAAE